MTLTTLSIILSACEGNKAPTPSVGAMAGGDSQIEDMGVAGGVQFLRRSWFSK